jgi:hypothetical protein
MTDPRPTNESDLIEQIRSIDVRAPESLHRQVDALIADKSTRAARDRHGTERTARGERSFGLAPRLAAVGAFAAVILALVLAVSLSGGSSTLSVRDASALTLKHATTGPPAESPENRRVLTAAVDGVAFPYWGERFGWRSTGARSDHVDGRDITTIFYANRHGQRIGYSIVAGTAPAQMSGGVVSTRDGTPYRLLTVNSVAVVSWLRNGRLCVVAGRGVGGATLLRLASWDEHRSVAS